MAIAAAALAFVCFTLFVLLVGRHRGANREEARLQRIAKDVNDRWLIERQKVRHLQERNAELRDELDLSQPCEASLTAEWTAYLATLPVMPVSDPGEDR